MAVMTMAVMTIAVMTMAGAIRRVAKQWPPSIRGSQTSWQPRGIS